MNELIGDLTLTLFFLMILYLMIASRLKFGFDTTVLMAIPVVLIGGMMFGAFSAIYAFVTIGVGIMLGWVFEKILKS